MSPINSLIRTSDEPKESRNRKAKLVGLLVGISGTLYFLSISRVSTVYVDIVNKQWVAWRERIDGDYKIIATGNLYEFVLSSVVKYLKYIKKNQF